MEFKPLDPDKRDEIIAGSRPRDEVWKDQKRMAQERIQAKREADREDAQTAQTLEKVKATRNAAIELIRKYDEAISEVVERLGEDHECSQVLRAAQQTPEQSST